VLTDLGLALSLGSVFSSIPLVVVIFPEIAQCLIFAYYEGGLAYPFSMVPHDFGFPLDIFYALCIFLKAVAWNFSSLDASVFWCSIPPPSWMAVTTIFLFCADGA